MNEVAVQTEITSGYVDAKDGPRSKSVSSRPLLPMYLRPVIAFGATWLLICGLYSLRLSNLIMYGGTDVLRLVGVLLSAFVAGWALSSVLPVRLAMPSDWTLPAASRTAGLLDHRLRFWFRLWCVLTLVEIAYSGGIPSVWLITGNPKTYMDFGIPTIHGFMNSLLSSICLVRLGMALRFGRTKDLRLPVWALIWSVLVITRQLMLVFLLESAVVYCTYRAVKPKRIVYALIGLICLILLFGAIGDLRTGAEAFRALAQPTSTYPEWLPSGILWFYMYLSTPVNNLIYTFHTTQPLYDWRFPNTLAQIFPSVLRNIFYSANDLGKVNGDLVTEAFNVSTAFAGPFQDFGLTGVILVTFCMSLLSGSYWRKTTFRDRLCYAVLCQCLMMTVFYDHFVLLPVISQMVWIYVFFYRTNGEVSE